MHVIRFYFVLIVTFFVVCLFTLGVSQAEQVQLTWNDLNNSAPEVGGYNLYYWQTDWDAPAGVDVKKQMTYTLTGLEAGQTYHFAVTAYDNKAGYSAPRPSWPGGSGS
jgi:hypothetical protein